MVGKVVENEDQAPIDYVEAYEEQDWRFHNGFRRYSKLKKVTRFKPSPFYCYMMKVRHLKSVLKYNERHGVSSRSAVYIENKAAVERNRRLAREFIMNSSDDILSATGEELDLLVERFNVDPNLPTRDKQEEVLEAMANKYIRGDSEGNKKEIARQKQHFLSTLEKTHFINLTCSVLQIKESLVRTWIRTDPMFAAEVLSTQQRFGERVAHVTLVKAMNGDMAAAMYVLKEFKESIKFIDPQVEDAAVGVSSSGTSLDNLTLEEQETLLHLTRKARQKVIDNGEDVSLIEVDMTGDSLIGVPAIEEAAEKFADVDIEPTEEDDYLDDVIIEEYEGD